MPILLSVLNIITSLFSKFAPVIAGYLFRRAQEKSAADAAKIKVLEKENEKVVEVQAATRKYSADGATKRMRDGSF